MKLAKLMKRLGWLCFLLVWIPFAVIMFKGPLSIAMNGAESVGENMADDFFGEMGIWIGLSVGLAVLSSVLIFGSVVVNAITNRRTISTGLDAEARIIDVRDSGTRINDNPVLNFTLEVRPPGHPVFVAETSQKISFIYVSNFQPGKILKVRYVPGTDRVAIIGVKEESGV